MTKRVTLNSIVRAMVAADADRAAIYAEAAQHGFVNRVSIDANITAARRASGKAKRVETKRQTPFATSTLSLSRRAAESASRAAKERGFGDTFFIKRVIEAIARDELWNAILDDGAEAVE